MVGFEIPNSPRELEIIKKLLSRVTLGFNKPNGP